MMKSHLFSIIRRLFVFAIMAFLSITLFGCQDPTVARMEAEHQRMGRMCQQEIRQAQLGSGARNVPAFPAPARTGTLYPAP